MMLLPHLIPILAQTGPRGTGRSAQGEFLDSISKNFSSEGAIASHWLFIAAGLVFILLSSVSIAQWWKHRNEQSHPWLIYLTTAHFVGLRLRDQWTLFWIAYQQKLASPLTLMLAPGTFDHHVKAYLDTRPGWRREVLHQKIEPIREHLFGELGAQHHGHQPDTKAA